MHYDHNKSLDSSALSDVISDISDMLLLNTKIIEVDCCCCAFISMLHMFSDVMDVLTSCTAIYHRL